MLQAACQLCFHLLGVLSLLEHKAVIAKVIVRHTIGMDINASLNTIGYAVRRIYIAYGKLLPLTIVGETDGATDWIILVKYGLCKRMADDHFLVVQHRNLLARDSRAYAPEVEVFCLLDIVVVSTCPLGSIGQVEGHAGAHGNTTHKGIANHPFHTRQRTAREECIVHFGGDFLNRKIDKVLRTCIILNRYPITITGEVRHIATVVILFLTDGRRSHVLQHKVCSRQSDHTHRQRRNTDEGLELVLEKIAEGDF